MLEPEGQTIRGCNSDEGCSENHLGGPLICEKSKRLCSLVVRSLVEILHLFIWLLVHFVSLKRSLDDAGKHSMREEPASLPRQVRGESVPSGYTREIVADVGKTNAQQEVDCALDRSLTIMRPATRGCAATVLETIVLDPTGASFAIEVGQVLVDEVL